MKNNSKLLFWVDAFLLHYCLAYYFQKNSNHDLYVILDISERLKPFFEKQQLVDFTNKWFYHDHIKSDQKPDLDYLEKFEKKYNLDLWNIALNERIFYKHNENYKFQRNEILSILESECRLFEKILSDVNPDFLVSLDFGLHNSNLLTKICQKKGIKILSISVSKFTNRCYLSEFTDTLMDESVRDNQELSFQDLQNLLSENNLSKSLNTVYSTVRKSNLTRISAGIPLLLGENNNINTNFAYYGRTKSKLISSEIKNLLRTWYRGNFLSKNSQKVIKNEKYVYLPLHQEPERSLLIDAPFYTNQIELIRHVAKSIPIHYLLYVKEHPTQGKARGWRPISEYKQILEIPNVKLIDPSVSSMDLIKNSDLVITVSGTASFEALIYEKPSIIFANYGYQKAGISKIDCLEDLPKIIKETINSKVDLKRLNSYVENLIHNSFEFDYYGFQIRSGDEFFHNGHIQDIEIEEEKMNTFLQKEKQNFELITNAHLKFIESNN